MSQSHLGPFWFIASRLKLRHLQLLAAFSRHPTLLAAAESLGMAQPAASKLIGDLEELMKIRLFRLEGRRMIPTYAGDVLTRHALVMLDELERTRVELNALVDGRIGHVSIGAIDGPVIQSLSEMLRIAQEDYPEIELEIRSGPSDTLFQMLVDGQIDIMLGRRPVIPSPHPVAYEEIANENLVVAAAPDHPLAQNGPLTLETLATYPWILQRRGSRSRQRLEELLQEQDLPLPTRVVSSDSWMMTLAYITRTRALTLLSAPAAAMQCAIGQIAILPINFTLDVAPWGVMTTRDRAQTPAALTILSLLRRCIALPDEHPAAPDT
ncbi:LysR family transcriptional regulator [Asaia krungthepensis]|uniref:LysR family transcriptional regulator n=1 Tax=Asaia krungthepensis NRIC 0535 TaxID=1307925 RepID=A0ABQ0Q219_9PROT|nr:LysR family transcriptional regulator [Asaia krungthepensis]GBQ87609.1 LysR family transcriptional regulator [Asaia krungthepensis NRIC 0535]